MRAVTTGACVRVLWVASCLWPVATFARAQAPVISSVSPSVVSTDVSLRVTGTGLGATVATNVVIFEPTSGAPVPGVVTGVSAADATGTIRRVTVRVPGGLAVGSGRITVRNTASGLASAPAPVEIVSISCGLAVLTAGTTVDLPITLQGNGAFDAASNRVTPGAGLTVNRVTVQSPTQLVANLTVSPSAPLGPRTLGVLTPAISAIAPDAFRVVSPAPQNRPPTAVIGGAATGTAGQPVSLDGNGSFDPDNDALTFDWSYGDGSAGSGKQVTKAYANTGTYSVTLTVMDGRGGSATATRSITIEAGAPPNGPPVITSSPVTAAKVDRAYGYRVVATDPDNDSLVFRLLAAPQGMQVSSDGVISWTPLASQAGQHFVTVEARDPGGNTAQQVFSVTVTAPATLNSIAVTPAVIDFVSVGAEQALKVTGLFSDASTLDLTAAVTGTTYESGNTGVATVSAGGLVTSAGSGSTTITVRNGASSATAQVRVALAPSLTALTLSPRRTTLRSAGATIALTLTGTYSDGATRDLTAAPGVAYESGAPGVATVSAVGVVTATTGGRATITARFSGLSAPSDIDVVVDSGAGFARGEVYDDRTGLPLGGATVTVLVDGGTDPPAPRTTTADERGRFVLPARAGTIVVRVEKAGFATVDRTGTVPSDGVLTLLDARLPPRDARVNAIQSVFGGRARNLAGTVSLDMPAGGLSGDASVTVTDISNQGLAGRVPLGWSPVGGVEIAPATLRFERPATLRLPNPDARAPSSNVVMARYDTTRRAWVATEPAQVAPDGATVVASVREPGQYVALVADAAPFTPPAPVIGDELAGVSPIAFPAGLSARGVVVPRSAPPGDAARAVGSVLLISPVSLPSGLVVRARVTEQFDLLDRSRVIPLPYTQDVVVYARPRLADDVTLGTKLPITPSQSFTIQQLALGTVRLDIRTDAAEDGGGIVTTDGGSLAGPAGILLDVPAGAVPSDTVVGLSELASSQLPLSLPAGFSVLGAVAVETIGVQLGAPAELSIVSPGGLDASSQVWLGEVFADPFGVPRLRLVGAVDVQASRLVSRATFAGVPLAGVRGTGRYVFVRAANPLGLLVGSIRQPGGAPPQGGVLVSVDTAPFADVSAADGRAVVAGTVGVPTTATANDPATGNGGAASSLLPAVQAPVAFTLALGVVAPTVIATTPAANAVDVPLDSSITVTFSEAIDAATLTSESFSVRMGASDIAGTRVLSADRLRATFRPGAPLAGNATFTLALSTAIRDLTGNGLVAGVSFTFRTLDPSKPQVAPGQITAALPDEDGFVLISASPGTSEGGRPVTATNPRTQETATVLALADGSFRLRLAATLGDQLSLTFRNTAGADTTFALLQFAGPDGTTSIGRDGGTVNGAGGRVARVLPRALTTPGTFRFVDADTTAFPAATPEFSYRDRFGLQVEGAQFADLRSLSLTESQNRFAPAQAVDAPFAAEASLVVPTDFLVGGSLRFVAVATDDTGARTTANAATPVVGTNPQTAAAETAADAQFPAVYVRTPQQAQPDLQVIVSAVAPSARVDFEVITAQAAADVAFLLVSPVNVGGETRLLALDQFSATTVSGSTSLRTSGRLLPGVAASADLAIVDVPGGVALLTGRVTGPPAVITADGWPFVARTTTANGRFVLAVRPGSQLTLRFLDATTFTEQGTASVLAPASGGTADVGSPLGAPSATLTVSATPDAQSLVDIGDPIVLTFGEPVDPSSINSTSIVVTDTAGRRVLGSLVRSDDGQVVTFTPLRRWKYGTRYRYGASLAVRAQSGATLAQPFSGEFTTFAPKVIGTIALGDTRDVAVANGLAWVATATGVAVVDVTNPAAPAQRASITIPGGGRAVALLATPFTDRLGQPRTGTHGLVAHGDPASGGFLEIYDLAAPDAPTRIGRTQVSASSTSSPSGFDPLPPGTPRHLSLDGTRALVTVDGAGVQVVDVPKMVPLALSEPGLGLGPKLGTPAGTSAHAAMPFGDRLLLAGQFGVRQHDAATLAVVGQPAGLPAAGLVVVDAGAVEPALVAGHDQAEGVTAMAVAASGDGEASAQIVRAVVGQSPQVLGLVRLPAGATGVAADQEERVAYAGLGSAGVALIDLAASGGLNPVDADRDAIDDRILGAVSVAGRVDRIGLDSSRGLAWLAAGGTGLISIQVLPPRVRFLSLRRDPIKGRTGDEQDITATRTAFTSDQALLVQAKVVAFAGDAPSFVIDEAADGAGPRVLSFEGGATAARFPGQGIDVDIATGSTGARFRIRAVDSGGRTLATLDGRLAQADVSALSAERLIVHPAALTLSDAEPSAQLTVGAVAADGRVLNVTNEPGTTFAVDVRQVAEVMPTGLVVARNGGTAGIAVGFAGRTSAALVSVLRPPVAIDCTPARATLTVRAVPATGSVPVLVQLSDGSTRALEDTATGIAALRSSDGSVLSVANGSWTALAAGEATVVVDVDGRACEVAVAVEPRRPTTIAGISIAPMRSPVFTTGPFPIVVVTAAGSGSFDGIEVALDIQGSTPGSLVESFGIDGRVAVPLEEPLAAGEYEARASAVDPATGQARVATASFVVMPAPADTEPNDTAAQASLLTVRDVVSGIVGGGDAQDLFTFSTPRVGQVTWTIEVGTGGASQSAIVEARAPDGRLLQRVSVPAGSSGSLSVPATSTDAIVLSVSAQGGALTYRVTTSLDQGPVTITRVTPPAGPAGTVVAIEGTGFSTDPRDVSVYFAGILADVLSVAPNRVEASVPANAANGAIRLVVAERAGVGPVFATGLATAPRPSVNTHPAQFRRDPATGLEVELTTADVRFAPSVTRAQADAALQSIGGVVAGVRPTANVYVVRFPQHRTIDDLAASLQAARALPGVRAVAPVNREYAEDASVDVRDRSGKWPGTPEPRRHFWDMVSLFEAVDAIRATPPFDKPSAFRRVRLAVIDSGFNPGDLREYTHGGNVLIRFLQARGATNRFEPLDVTQLFDVSGHGTQVTSLLAALNNGNDFSGGVASVLRNGEAPFFTVDVFACGSDDGGLKPGCADDALEYIKDATTGPESLQAPYDVINMSLGSNLRPTPDKYQDKITDFVGPTIGALLDTSLIVASAANYGIHNDYFLPAGYSAHFANVMSIGAVAVGDFDLTGEDEDERAVFSVKAQPLVTHPQTSHIVFRRDVTCDGTPIAVHRRTGSNCGPHLNLVAPGERVLAASLSGPNLGTLASPAFNGTSAAAPIVSVGAAIVMSLAGPAGLRPADLARLLVRTGDDISERWRPDTGVRRLNILSAVRDVLPATARQKIYVSDVETTSQAGRVIGIEIDPMTGARVAGASADALIPLTVSATAGAVTLADPLSMIVSPSGTQLHAVAHDPASGPGIVTVSTRSLGVERFVPFSTPQAPVQLSTRRPGLALSRDGSVLYVGTGSGLVVVNVKDGRVVRSANDLPAPFDARRDDVEADLIANRLEALTALARRGAGLPGQGFSSLDLSPDGRTLYAVVETGGGTGQQPGFVVPIDVNLYADAVASTRAIESDLSTYLTPLSTGVLRSASAGEFRGGDEPSDIAVAPDGRAYLTNGGVNSFETLPPSDLSLDSYRAVLWGTIVAIGGASFSGTAALGTFFANVQRINTALYQEMALDLKLQAESGVTLLSAPGVTNVFKDDTEEWVFPSDVVFAWDPPADNGGRIVNQFRFKEVFAKRPFGIAVRPDGRRAVVSYFQTGNFGVLDKASEPSLAVQFVSPDSPFSGVVAVTPAVRLDNHLWPRRGAFTSEDGKFIPSPDESLLFPSQVEYAQNGRFAVAVHTGVRRPSDIDFFMPDFSLVEHNDVRLALNNLGFEIPPGSTSGSNAAGQTVRAFAPATFRRGGGAVSVLHDDLVTADLDARRDGNVGTPARPFYTQHPLCETHDLGASTCVTPVTTTHVAFDPGSGPVEFARPRGVAIQPFVSIEAPRHGASVSRRHTLVTSWRDARAVRASIVVHDVGPEIGPSTGGVREVVSLGPVTLTPDERNRQVLRRPLSALLPPTAFAPGRRLQIRVRFFIDGGEELSSSSVEVVTRP